MRRWKFVILAGVMIAAGGFLSHQCASADPSTTAAAKNWSRPIYYDPPNQTKLKFRLTGADASQIPNSGGSIKISGAQIKQFSLENGTPQMTAETAACIYSPHDQTLSSSNVLKVHAQEDRLFLEGTGFVLFQTNSTLLVSNATHSILRNTGTNGELFVTDISSTAGEFRMKSEATNGSAIYREHVRLRDPRIQLQAELLTADLPRDGTDSRHIVAETNVTINFHNEKGGQLQALGDRAVYNYAVENGVTNELIELTGNPRVNLTNGWMTADLITLNRVTGKVMGETNFHFHYFGQPNTNSAVNTPTDIYSEHFDYDLNTRLANFRRQVRMDDVRLRLASEQLTTTLPESGATNDTHPENILAEQNVIIDIIEAGNDRKTRATGEKAEYHYSFKNGVTNEVLTLTGNPAIQVSKPEGWMTAEVITVDRIKGTITGAGNHHSVIKKKTAQPDSQDTEIFSDRFEYSQATGIANYKGNIRAYDPEINLTSRSLTLTFSQAVQGQTNHLEKGVATGNVALDIMDKPFYHGDITNLAGFARRLISPKPEDGVGNYFRAQLQPETRSLLAFGNLTNDASSLLQTALIAELNRWVAGRLIYEPARFSNVFLSVESNAGLRTSSPGMELMVLNRLLLLDAFRGELARNKKGEKTHGTGDQAIYTYQEFAGNTNSAAISGILELRGHPRLDKANGWITAQEAIIDDRATGICKFVGQPKFYTPLDGILPAKTTVALKNNSK